MAGQKEISVFVDESGSFDASDFPSRYYIVCFLFHDQSVEIDNEIGWLETELTKLGLPREHCVHAGPLIRREQDYAKMSRDERRLVFSRMLAFVRRLKVAYRCFVVDKKFITQAGAIHDDLMRQMVKFLIDNMDVFGSYETLKVYYDNGQGQIRSLLEEAFALFSAKTIFVPEVTPSKYRLFQAADLLCTIELTKVKLESEKRISESEKKFFVSIQNFKKRYLKPMLQKLWR